MPPKCRRSEQHCHLIRSIMNLKKGWTKSTHFSHGFVLWTFGLGTKQKKFGWLGYQTKEVWLIGVPNKRSLVGLPNRNVDNSILLPGSWHVNFGSGSRWCELFFVYVAGSLCRRLLFFFWCWGQLVSWKCSGAEGGARGIQNSESNGNLWILEITFLGTF